MLIHTELLQDTSALLWKRILLRARVRPTADPAGARRHAEVFSGSWNPSTASPAHLPVLHCAGVFGASVKGENEEAAGNKRKLDIAGFDDPSDSDDDEEYNSGDEVEEWNHKSFIEHEANKIREKGKAAYYKWGKFRCPYCTTKPIPKDGLYEHLMSHARGVATSGNDVKIRAEHAALLKAMGPI